MVTYLASVWSFRYFWLALVRNDLRNRYRRSILGVGWSLLQPDRHDGRAVPGLRPRVPRLRAGLRSISIDRADLLGLCHRDGKRRLRLLFPGGILYPPAPRHWPFIRCVRPWPEPIIS